MHELITEDNITLSMLNKAMGVLFFINTNNNCDNIHYIYNNYLNKNGNDGQNNR